MKKKGLSMEDTAKALRAAYPPTHAPRKPTRMVRVGWQVTYPDGTEIGVWRAKSDTEKYVEALDALVYSIYAKRTDVKGSGK